MKVTKIAVTVTKTVQVVQFEPVTVSLTHEAELEKGDDLKESVAELHDQIGSQVRKLIKAERERWAKKSK